MWPDSGLHRYSWKSFIGLSKQTERFLTFYFYSHWHPVYNFGKAFNIILKSFGWYCNFLVILQISDDIFISDQMAPTAPFWRFHFFHRLHMKAADLSKIPASVKYWIVRKFWKSCAELLDWENVKMHLLFFYIDGNLYFQDLLKRQNSNSFLCNM